MKLLIEIKPETHENATAIISSMNCKSWIPSTNITNKFAKNTAGILIMNDNLNAVLGLNLLNSRYEVVIPDLEIPGITANPCKIPVAIATLLFRFLSFFKSDLIVFWIIPVIINPSPIINVNRKFPYISRRLEKITNPIMLDDIVDKIMNVVSEFDSVL